MSLMTPLNRVLGLGRAAGVAEHWWLQRMTAVALLPLGLWLAYQLLTLRSSLPGPGPTGMLEVNLETRRKVCREVRRRRPEVIVAKACAIATGISSTLPTRWLTPTIPAIAAVRSRVSCRKPLPRPGRRSGIPAETSSTGTESE